jgi:ribosome biogenesis GTPase
VAGEDVANIFVRSKGQKVTESPESLDIYGWNRALAEAFSQPGYAGLRAGRVIAQREKYDVVTERGILRCQPSGRMKYRARGQDALPAVGDWVALRPNSSESSGIIVSILPRKSKFVRKVPGDSTLAQVIATNFDVLLLISGLDGEFNPSRIERYLLLARDSGADPVIVLNKSDLCTDLDVAIALATEVAPGTRVIATSVTLQRGIDVLRSLLPSGTTGALLGSSGVGKSSLLNVLAGEERMRVGEVRETDSRGRHTTAHRELILLPNGGMLIDTPGLRELQLWSEGEGLQDAFQDIESMALQCRFTDCSHDTEPGCAIREAIEYGRIASELLESYRKLQRELAHLERKHSVRGKIENKRAIKKVTARHKRGYRRGNT